MATRTIDPVLPPVVRPTQSPVRDDAALGPTEDLDRAPDGVPHHVIGLTALFSVMLALLIAIMFISGSTVGRVTAVLLALLAIPVIVSSLDTRSARERNHVHPSK